MYNERKTAQIAAWFLAQERGRMSHLKLVKLLYFADRESMKRFATPMTGDRFVSMPHGPVLSLTLERINGNIESVEDGWDTWISDKENHCVELMRSADREELDELSDAEMDVLRTVWGKLGHMSKYEIRDYTHSGACPEYEDPRGSSLSLPYSRVFEAVGFEPAIARELALEIEAHDRSARLLAA